MTQFTEEVLVIIQRIPQGRVMSYGQVAKLACDARGARQVARILHSMTQKYNLPWHRVINSEGRISIAGGLAKVQKELLQSEGVEVSEEGYIDFSKYGV